MSKKSKKKSFSLTLRNYFITGVVVLIPIGFTLYLTKILIGISSNLIPKNINPNSYLPFNIPGVEIAISVMLITIVGGTCRSVNAEQSSKNPEERQVLGHMHNTICKGLVHELLNA